MILAQNLKESNDEYVCSAAAVAVLAAVDCAVDSTDSVAFDVVAFDVAAVVDGKPLDWFVASEPVSAVVEVVVVVVAAVVVVDGTGPASIVVDGTTLVVESLLGVSVEMKTTTMTSMAAMLVVSSTVSVVADSVWLSISLSVASHLEPLLVVSLSH